MQFKSPCYRINHEWQSFYEGTGTEKDGISPLTDGEFYIHETKFVDLSDTVISVNTSKETTKLLLENTFFNNINLPKNHGSPCIHYESRGQCVQSKICTIKTSVASEYWTGGHGIITVNESKTHLCKNYLIDSTIADCGRYGLGVATVTLLRGEINVRGLNISYNVCITCCCFRIQASDAGTTNFSTCFNNSACSQYAIEYNGVRYEGNRPVEKLLYYLNILNNEASTSILNGEQLLIKNSVIKNNTAPYIFSSPTVTTLINCYCKNASDNYQKDRIKNMQRSSIDLLLLHLRTWLCSADIEFGFNYVVPVEETLHINKCSNDFSGYLCRFETASKLYIFFNAEQYS